MVFNTAAVVGFTPNTMVREGKLFCRCKSTKDPSLLFLFHRRLGDQRNYGRRHICGQTALLSCLNIFFNS